MLVWSFVLVLRRNLVLTYRQGRYREDRDSFLQKRSVGFFSPVVHDDLTLFDQADHGIVASGIRALTVDLNSMPDPQLTRTAVLRSFICANEDDLPNLLGLITFQAPDWFEPFSRRLAINDLAWHDLQVPVNHFEDFDPWSRLISKTYRGCSGVRGKITMQQPRRKSIFIGPTETAYLDLLIADKDPESKKIGLQQLCKLYRRGLRYRRPDTLRVHLMGLLHHQAPKVKRWALNALALAGTSENVSAITEAIQRNRNDPDILGAGVSALCALLPVEEARKELERADLPLSGAILMAAVQHSAHFQSELRVARVKIDYADPPELRLAGVLVGLDKAPEHLFSLTIPNRDIIGELNSHPDFIVAQYSIWATYENSSLSIKNLRLPLHDVELKPPNVRKYVYQLVAKDTRTAQDNFEFLVLGSEDDLRKHGQVSLLAFETFILTALRL